MAARCRSKISLPPISTRSFRKSQLINSLEMTSSILWALYRCTEIHTREFHLSISGVTQSRVLTYINSCLKVRGGIGEVFSPVTSHHQKGSLVHPFTQSSDAESRRENVCPPFTPRQFYDRNLQNRFRSRPRLGATRSTSAWHINEKEISR